jgi:alanine racemase
MSEDFEAARLTVRLGAVAANYRTYRRLAGPTAVAAVVKADAYGLGASRVALALAEAGCDSFFVARLEEGVALRKLLPRARIFVLDGAAPDAVPALISHRLTPVLNSLSEIAAWSAAAGVGQSALDAVIHVDTGMNRLGLSGDELAQLSGDKAKRLAGLNLVLVMSHLACSDDPDNVLNGANPQVREGGVGSRAPNLMQTACVLTARVLQLRRIDSGESVGYGATFRAKRPSMLATVALGYADGFPRTLANKGVAMLNGARVPVVGRISMDLMILDVTELSEAPHVGDEAELLGDRITLGEVAAMAGTNEYEILTRLRRVPRIYEG